MRARIAAYVIVVIAAPICIGLVIWFTALGMAREVRQKIRKGL